ncbi:MAG TPA: M28 family peptidase [Chthonomonadaceae bacterium]|nr:M28 family peptidase [Chthonomonadaceae bacterium]
MDIARALLDQVSEENLRRNLFCLAKDPFPYRKLNYTLPGHQWSTLHEVDAWLTAQLHSYGYAVEREGCAVQAFGYDPAKPLHHRYAPPPPGAPVHIAYNLYAQKVGRRYPEEIILLLAHKDSQSWVDSPGAYDNGVGTVAVLELARVLAEYSSERTIRFLFCNEEHTPWTSVTAAENARRRGDNLIAVFNLDSLGGKSDEEIAAGRKTNVTLYTVPEGRRLADLMTEVNAAYQIGLDQSAQQREAPGDDDGSFVKAGYGCTVMNIGSYPYADAQYHLEGDVPERVDIVNVRMAAQATLAAVLTLDR